MDVRVICLGNKYDRSGQLLSLISKDSALHSHHITRDYGVDILRYLPHYSTNNDGALPVGLNPRQTRIAWNERIYYLISSRPLADEPLILCHIVSADESKTALANSYITTRFASQDWGYCQLWINAHSIVWVLLVWPPSPLCPQMWGQGVSPTYIYRGNSFAKSPAAVVSAQAKSNYGQRKL